MKFKRILALLLVVVTVVNSIITTANAETIFGLVRNSELVSADVSMEASNDTENRESTIEPYNGTEFDPYIYMANNILSSSTLAGKSFNFYNNEVDTIADIFKGSVTPEFEVKVGIWETTNLALKPEDIPKKAIDAKGYYMTVILSMIQEAYTTDEINTKLVNSNFKQVSKLYSSFAKLYKEMCLCDVEDTLKQYDFTDKQKSNYRAVAKEFLGQNGFIFAADTLNTFLDLCEVCEKPLEYIKKLFEYCSLYTATVEWKECLQLMYNKAPKSNIPLRSALDALLTASKGWDGIVFQIWQDGAAEISVETHKLLIGTLISEIADACPLIKGMRLGVSIGKGISNLLFSVDKTIEEYYVVCAFCEVEDLFKSVFRDVIVQYKNNKNSSNAEKFLKYLEMYFKVLNTGNDFGTDFGKQLCDGSIASKIAYSKEAYQSFVKSAESMSRKTNEAYEHIIRLWLLDLFNESPEQYEIYAVEFGDPEKGYLPVSSIKFEQNSVEWGLNDHIFNGYTAQAYPENASNRELTYTTSNKNVAEIMPNGYLEVRGLGKCTITATSVENDSAFDTLNVTVVEQDGKDSKRIEEIFPTTAPEFAVPKFDYSINSDGTITLNQYRDTARVVVIPETIDGKIVKAIGEDCFSHHYYYDDSLILTSVIIPNSVTSIGYGAFAHNYNLTSVTIPDSVTSIGADAFAFCQSLTSATIPDNVTSIGNWAFIGCTNLISVKIGNSVTSIGDSAFDSTNLTSVTIPNSVTSIGGYAFAGTNLTSVTIPNSVTEIDEYAFKNCTSLKHVTMPICSVSRGVFNGCSNIDLTISNGATMVDYYKYYTFRGMDEIVSVTIPNSVTSISDEAFYGCTNLTSVTIPNSVTSIGKNAFCGCTSLTTVTIPDSVTNIYLWAFANCTNLTSVTIPNSVTRIDDAAFNGCTSLKDVYYTGTKEQWDGVTIDNGNNVLLSATIHYEGTSPINTPIKIDIPKISGNKVPDTSKINVTITRGDKKVANLPIDNDGNLDLTELDNGIYNFTFEANNCAPRAYDVTVSDGSVSGLEVELHLYGDINGDGKVNMMDVGKANAHAKNTAKLSGYDLSVSDINGDGKINMQDVGLMNAHAKNTKSLW